MAVLEVGKPYVAGRSSIEPRAEYNFRAGQHELLLVFSRLANAEIACVSAGEAEFALVIYGLVIFFLYRFPPAIGWSDAPFSWHRIPASEREFPSALATEQTRASLSVVLVDADANTVRALRVVPFSPAFTRALRVAISEQAEGWWDQGEFDAQLRTAYASWRTTDQLLDRAIARTTGGA